MIVKISLIDLVEQISSALLPNYYNLLVLDIAINKQYFYFYLYLLLNFKIKQKLVEFPHLPKYDIRSLTTTTVYRIVQDICMRKLKFIFEMKTGNI